MTRVLVDLLQTTGTKGGIEAYIRELYSSEEFHISDFDFVAFASKEFAKSGSNWFPGEVIDSGVSGENRIDWARGELFGVSKAAKKYGADLIHCPAMLGPLRSHVPTVITIHDLSYFTHPELMRNKFYTWPVRWMEKRAAANAKRVISISQSTSEAIKKYLAVPESKIDLIYSAGRKLNHNFVDSLSRDKCFFIAMGQRSPYKKLETVIEAWALIPPNQRPRLIVTGSHGSDPLKLLVDKYSLEDSVQLLGWVSDGEITNLLSIATALIETTVAAGFGMPALEAMQIGLPVITTDIPVFREITGGNALFYSPGNPHDLARVVSQVVTQPQSVEGMSESGFKWQQKYTWAKCAKSTLESFENAISS